MANNSVVVHRFARPIPADSRNTVERISEDGAVTVKFDFGEEVRKECLFRLGLIFFIMTLLIVSALYLTNAVSSIALLPLEELFSQVQDTAKTIFSSLVSVAGSAPQRKETVKDLDEVSDASSDVDADAAMYSETLVLEKVIKKITKVSALMMNKDPLEDLLLDESNIAVLFGYQVIAGPKRTDTMTTHGTLEQESKENIDQVIEETLVGCDMKRDRVTHLHEHENWDFNPFDVNERQKNTICMCLLLNQRHSGHIGHQGLSGQRLAREDLQLFYINFIDACSLGYNSHKDTPYHNWYHAVDVTVAMNSMMRTCRMDQFISDADRFGLLVAAIAHDVGHPGLNNTFLVETQDDLAIRYNDDSPLENMHTAVLFEMSRKPGQEIFASFKRGEYGDVRETIIQAILYTDYQNHVSVVKDTKSAYEAQPEIFDLAAHEIEEGNEFLTPELLDYYKTVEAQKLFKSGLLHFCDVSNPMKTWSLCKLWANLIMEEFFVQGDMEKKLGIAVQPLNNRERSNKPYSQIGFMQFFVGPLMSAFNFWMPPLDFCMEHLASNAASWVDLWADETMPTPDMHDQEMVLERIVKMSMQNRLTSGGLANRRSALQDAMTMVPTVAARQPKSSVFSNIRSSIAPS